MNDTVEIPEVVSTSRFNRKYLAIAAAATAAVVVVLYVRAKGNDTTDETDQSA